MHAANGSNNAVKCKPAASLLDDEIGDNKMDIKAP